eukprot:6373137-Amphidinium_carterae.1
MTISHERATDPRRVARIERDEDDDCDPEESPGSKRNAIVVKFGATWSWFPTRTEQQGETETGKLCY